MDRSTTEDYLEDLLEHRKAYRAALEELGIAMKKLQLDVLTAREQLQVVMALYEKARTIG